MVTVPLTISVKVVKIGNSLRMTIPAPVVKALRIEEGDTLEVGVEGNQIIVEKSLGG